MKLLLSTIIVICLTYTAHSQNATITIGRGTDCFGRGACSINTMTPENFNATLFQNSEGETILKIHRDKLTFFDENRVLGEKITPQNKSKLEFEMLESIQFSKEVRRLTSPVKSRQLSGISEGIYSVEISNEFIDIFLSRAKTSFTPY